MAGGRTREWSGFAAVFGAEVGERTRLAILMLSGIIVVGITGYIALGWRSSRSRKILLSRIVGSES
jgi:hypothetical protein